MITWHGEYEYKTRTECSHQAPIRGFLLGISIRKNCFLNVSDKWGRGQTSMNTCYSTQQIFFKEVAGIDLLYVLHPVFLGSEPMRKTNKQIKRASQRSIMGSKLLTSSVLD